MRSTHEQFDRSRRRAVMALGAATAVSAGSSVLNPLSAKAAGPTVNVRVDAGTFSANAAKFSKLEGAVREMMERSTANPADPKGWLANSKAHLDFCATPSITSSNQIHFCWWFLPWHRAYLVVTERKLREIAGDSTLALPYWNWSSERRIPSLFSRQGSALAKANRFTPARDLRDGEVGYQPNNPVSKLLGVEALAANRFMAENATQISTSFGGIRRPNAANQYGNGRLEGVPHGPVHVYVGGESNSGAVGDMTDFATAARDPVFFAHHGNLDRLWEIWRQKAGNRASEPSDSAFLQHKFVFTWLDGKSMAISVAEALDTRKLGYTYDSLSVFRPTIAAAPSPPPVQPTSDLPAIAEGSVSIPASAQEPGKASATRYILEISGITPPSRPLSVDVRMSPSGNPSAEISVGSFAAVLLGGRVVIPSDAVSFDVTEAIMSLGNRELRVRLIPLALGEGAQAYAPLAFRSMRIREE
jgi:hypothetical protein